MRQNFVAQFVQLLRCWLCDVLVGHCGEESNPFIAVGLVAHTIKNLPAMQETGFRSVRREHPQKEMATHSSILAWEIPQTDEPGGLPSMGSHRVGHD